MANEPLLYGQYYHIFNRGNNRENLFVERRNYPYFLKLFAEHILPVAETFAYCLIPNHFHFAIRTYTEEEQKIRQISEICLISEQELPFQPTPPSQAFKNLFIAYTRAFNRATGRTGTLFERPFHRKRVDSAAYFQQLIIYIHKNPQKHKLVEDFRDWPWSSYSAFGSESPSKINRAQVIDWFGGRQQFMEAHNQDLSNLEDLTNLGDDQ